jgi:hypothetical protein
MPGWNPAVPNGAKSVSEGKVTVRFEPLLGAWSVGCVEHGAMNKVTKEGIWRCLACHEACYEPKASNS